MRRRSHRRALQRLACAASAVLVLATGCLHNAVITTDPEGAEVWVQGQFLGASPATYRSRSGVPDTVTVRVEKPGYEPIKAAQIDKVYRADLSLLLLIPAFVPYFFTARFEDNYVFKLKPLPGTVPPGPAAPADKKDEKKDSSAPGAEPARPAEAAKPGGGGS